MTKTQYTEQPNLDTVGSATYNANDTTKTQYTKQLNLDIVCTTKSLNPFMGILRKLGYKEQFHSSVSRVIMRILTALHRALLCAVFISDVVLESGSVLKSDSSLYFEDSDLDSNPLDSDSDQVESDLNPLDSD